MENKCKVNIFQWPGISKVMTSDSGKYKKASKTGRKGYLSDPGVPGVRSMGPDVSQSVSQSLQEVFADLTDVTLADEDSNSIPTDDVNGQS